MQVKRRDIDSNLPRKGFVKREHNNGHTYFHYRYNGQEIGIFTYVSRGTGYDVYGDELLGKMKRQLRLRSTQQVFNLCTCPMDGGEYLRVLRENGKLNP